MRLGVRHPALLTVVEEIITANAFVQSAQGQYGTMDIRTFARTIDYESIGSYLLRLAKGTEPKTWGNTESTHSQLATVMSYGRGSSAALFSHFCL